MRRRSMTRALRRHCGARSQTATSRASWARRRACRSSGPAAPLRNGGGGIFVKASFVPEERALAALGRSLVEIGALVTLATALLGFLFAWPLSRRLRSAARIAGQIGAGERRVRIAMGGRDEVASLAGAVDRMADALEQRIDREQRFAADVAHELRTPVSGLVAASALLGDSEPAIMVRDRAQLLARLVQDLLEISRLEAGVETPVSSEVDLTALANSACGDLPVRVVGTGARVRSDPRRIARIISNLAENACRHGGDPVLVEVEDGRVRVSDKGPGFSPEMLKHATERFTSGSSARRGGIGLGLAIAAAQATVIGATLTLENPVGGGAIVIVSLPDLHETATSGV